jgi:mRNA interferase RelE/StbE
MAFYDVILKLSVEKDLRALSAAVRARILARLEHLREEPMPRQAVKLAGGEAWYRVRVGDYRIIYGVDTRARQITVHYIRHRRDVYRNL